MRRYGPDSYDDNFCLKPPFLLWLAVLYLSRGFVLFFLSAAGSMAALSTDTVTFIRQSLRLETVIPSIMGAAVLYALLRRAPGASKPVRWVWTKGQLFLAAAALADVAIQLIDSPMLHGDAYDQTAWPLVAAGLDLYFLAYVLASPRVRDTFAALPVADAPH